MAERFDPETQREIDRLRRALQLQEGFEFHLIVGHWRPTIDAAVEAVAPGIDVLGEAVRDGETPQQFATRWLGLLEAALAVDLHSPVVLDAWDADSAHREHWGRVFARLNERRNGIMRSLGRPMLLLVSPINERLLGRMAPDLWTVRGVGMRLPKRDMAVLEPAPTPRSITDADIEALSDQRLRFEATRDEGDPLSHAIEALRLARERTDAGDTDEARRVVEYAIKAYRRHPDLEVGLSGLAEALELKSTLARSSEPSDAALRPRLEAYIAREHLVCRFPGSHEYRRALYEHYERIGQERRELGDEQSAVAWLRRARMLMTEGVHRVRTRDTDQTSWVHRGRLHGLQAGDQVRVLGRRDMNPTVEVLEVLEDWARLARSADPSRERWVMFEHYEHRAKVWLSESLDERDSVRRTLEIQPRLRVIEDREHADFRVFGLDGQVSVSGPSWLHRQPKPATPDGIIRLAEDLDDVARSKLLLEVLTCGDQAAALSPWSAEVSVLTEAGHDRPLEDGESLPVGTRLAIEFTHVAQEGTRTFVNLLDRGVSWRLTCLNQRFPLGFALGPGISAWFHDSSGRGLRLSWPADVPMKALTEELIVVASSHPLDLRPLLAVDPLLRESEQRSVTRVSERGGLHATEPDLRPDAVGTPVRWEAQRFSFTLVP